MELSKAHISYARLRREYDEKMEIFQKVKKGGIKIELLSNNVISNHIDQYKKYLKSIWKNHILVIEIRKS